MTMFPGYVVHSSGRLPDEGALRTRISILEAALACVQRECDVAFEVPEVAFSTLCRIASVARQTMPCGGDAE